MLLFVFLPKFLWDEVALTIVYTINCLPSSILDNCTPYELLYDMNLDYSIF